MKTLINTIFLCHRFVSDLEDGVLELMETLSADLAPEIYRCFAKKISEEALIGHIPFILEFKKDWTEKVFIDEEQISQVLNDAIILSAKNIVGAAEKILRETAGWEIDKTKRGQDLDTFRKRLEIWVVEQGPLKIIKE